MDSYTFSEPRRLDDRVFFHAELNMRFGLDCLERGMPPGMRERIDAYAGRLPTRKFGMKGPFACKFFGNSILLRKISVPCFGYFGDFGMDSCNAELLDEAPCLLKEFAERGLVPFFYNPYNIPSELLKSPIEKLFGYWVKRAQEVLGSTQG